MFTNFKNWLQAILGGDTVKGLQSKSKSVLEVFDKTVKDLKEVNDKIIKERDLKQEIIENALFDVESLNSLHSKNTRVIDKINDIVS